MRANITVYPEPQPGKRSGFELVPLSIRLTYLGEENIPGEQAFVHTPPPHLLDLLLQPLRQGETEPARDRVGSQLDPSMVQSENFHT